MEYLWTKKLDVMHKYCSDRKHMSGTICGKPMLGNNYAEFFKDSDRKKCEVCFPMKRYALSIAGKGIVQECNAPTYDEAVKQLMSEYGVDIQEVEE